METRDFNPERQFHEAETHESVREQLEKEKTRLARLLEYRQKLETTPAAEH